MERSLRIVLSTLMVAGFVTGSLFTAMVPPAEAKSETVLTTEDVREIFRAVVTVETEVPTDARTAASLGRQREGSGVVIDGNGLVLTIGYLILEASSVSVRGPEGQLYPASIVAYDHETGFGLIRTLVPIDVKPVKIGSSNDLMTGDVVLALGHTGPRPITPQKVVDRRPFAGYWEYLLENAIFTSPPHPGYGGAPLIGIDGELIGIGSLFVGDAMQGDAPVPGNMFVPIDLLKPILAGLLTDGRRTEPAKPWLGLYTNETAGRVFVARVVEGGPAESAGIKAGDIIMGVNGKSVRGMVDFFRKVHSLGDAGSNIPVDVLSSATSDMAIGQIVVKSKDRHDWLKLRGGF
jgi:serine protease DegQ